MKFLAGMEYIPSLADGSAADTILVRDADSPNALLGLTIGSGLSVASGVLSATENDFPINAGSSWNSTSGLLTIAIPNQTNFTLASADLETYLNANLNFTNNPGTLTGSGSVERVAYWSSASALTNDGSFMWDASANVLNIASNQEHTAYPGIEINATGVLFSSTNQTYLQFNSYLQGTTYYRYRANYISRIELNNGGVNLSVGPTGAADSTFNETAWKDGLVIAPDTAYASMPYMQTAAMTDHLMFRVAAGGELKSRAITGTASATTYLRGDGSWTTPDSGGGSSSGANQSIQTSDGSGGFNSITGFTMGSTGIDLDSATSAYITLDRNATTNDAHLLFYTAGSSNWAIGQGVTDNTSFEIWNNGTPGEAAILIDYTNNNVGIGGASTGPTLHVHGAIQAQGSILSTANVTGDTIVKTGGTGSQILMANGTVSTNPGGWTSNTGTLVTNSGTSWTSHSSGTQLSFYCESAMNHATGDRSSLEVYSDGGASTDAFMQFHVGGDYALYFGLDGGTNKLSVGGWSMGAVSYEIYHAGNPQINITGNAATATNASTVTSVNGRDDSYVVGGDSYSRSLAIPTTYNAYAEGNNRSGFWEVNNGDSTTSPSSGWFWGLTAAHRGNHSSYNYAGQLAWGISSGLWYRTISAGSGGSWNQIVANSGSWSISVTGSSASCSGLAATATWADTVDVNNGNNANSNYYAVWHSGDTLYSTNGITFHPLNNTISASNFIDASDVRLKKDIRLIEPEYLRKFKNIEPIQYRLKEGKGNLQFGAIAQQIQPYYPEIITVGDKGYLGIDYRSLAMLNLAVTQSHETRLQRLERENKEMKKELKELKAA